MAELPLSKFAPFNKDESKFQYEVSNKLNEVGVKCSNCIYFGDKVENYTNEYYNTPLDKKQKYICNILSDKWVDNLVCEDSLCRFFTSIEETKESGKSREDNSKTPDEELSIQIQKLDFTNSNITESINKLREALINE